MRAKSPWCVVAVFGLVIITLLLAGCGSIRHDYVWNEYEINEERLPAPGTLDEGKTIRVTKGVSATSEVYLGGVGRHQYYATLQTLTNAVADHLSTQLESLNVQVGDEAQKSIEIMVTRHSFETGMWKIAATLDFEIKLGDGTSKTYEVRNSTPGTVDGLYNGAAALAVVEILKDADVLAYING